MPINKETIISVFDEKLTLMQWLKTINKALEDAVLTGVEITKKGNATLSFKFTFEDGTFLETNDLVLQQGESVVNAFIQNGHLYLTLSNGTNLDAGNVKPVSNFSIDANQHLIVNYGDGTSQDLGAIFNGNVNISGTLNATKVTGNEIVETMAGYACEVRTITGWTNEKVYIGACKNGNKLTFVIALNITKETAEAMANPTFVGMIIPSSVGAKLYPSRIGYLDTKQVCAYKNYNTFVALDTFVTKISNTLFYVAINNGNALEVGTTYYYRYEVTFLLGDSL